MINYSHRSMTSVIVKHDVHCGIYSYLILWRLLEENYQSKLGPHWGPWLLLMCMPEIQYKNSLIKVVK